MSVRDKRLDLEDLTVSFDGFKALNKLTLHVDPGELLCVIGPNGAGKTTMMDVITGKTRPDEGEVMFDGRHDLTKLDEAEIATLGGGRRHDRPRDRGDRRSPARNRARSFGDRGRARHAFRARARRQGDLPSRGLGAGRGHARPGERRSARRRSLSGAVNAC